MAPLLARVFKVHKVFREDKVLRVFLENLLAKELRELKEDKDFRVFKAFKELKV
jgi:hypothetical protein